MFIQLTKLMEWDSDLYKLDQKTNVLKENVNLVPNNVEFVKKKLTNVSNVQLTELMLQNVTAHKECIMMKLTHVENAMLNVKVVSLIIFVLIVLNNLIELLHKIVHVTKDIMMMVLLYVENVILNV